MLFREYVTKLDSYNLTDDQKLACMYLPLSQMVCNGEFLSTKLFKFYIELRNLWLDLGIERRVDTRHWYVTTMGMETSL